MTLKPDSGSERSTEKPGCEGGRPFSEERTNGRTPPLNDSTAVSEPSWDKGSEARDSLGSRVSVSETDAGDAVPIAPDVVPLCDGLAGAAEPSGSTAAAVADSVRGSAYFADLDVPGADVDDSLPPFVVESSPKQVAEARAFFLRAKSAETSKQVERARTRSRVFSLMQYYEHPEMGGVIFTQEQVDGGLEALHGSIHRYAYIWHPFDRLVLVDEGTGEPFCCGLKGLHIHVTLWMTEDRPTIRTVSDAFAIPSSRVRAPKEVAAQEGAVVHKGRNAAEKAFFDLAEYLPHESRGQHALKGITQPERFYLVDKSQDGNPGKYQYGRGRVVANFDFGRELDAHMAGRVSAAEGGSGLRARKIKLRRAVMDGMPLTEAREKDRDAYADDLPRLRELAREYEELEGKKVAAQIGMIWRKSLVVATGATRQGKDTLLTEVATQLVGLAALAGLEWSAVKPAGRNTLEGIGRSEIVHHEDARYKLVPDYDEGLRYFDPNQAIEAATRFTNTAAPTPRVIMMSSSETLLSLGYTLKRRASSEHLAELAGNGATTPKYPLDIDELLYRIGWYVEVVKSDDAGDDLEAIRESMLLSIYRVREGTELHRVETVLTRGGDRIGEVRTQHVLEPVAVIRGCENAARFLAVSIIQERNPDVAEAIPLERMRQLVASRSEIEADAKALEAQRERERVADAEQVKRLADERDRAAKQRQAARLEEEQRLLELCTCDSAPPVTCLHRHEDACPLLTDDERRGRDDERRKQEEARQRALVEKAAEVRANGWLLTAPK